MQTAKEPVLSVVSAVGARLGSRRIRVERKLITFDLRENPRGQFLRITEEVDGRRNAIVIPLPGLEQFRDMLNEVIESSKGS